MFERLFQQERKKHSLGVCIPEAGRRRAKKNKETETIGSAVGFRVTGIFHVHDSHMVQGMPIGGTIRKKDSAQVHGIKLVVIDIQAGTKSSNVLEEGTLGALFLHAEKDRYPIIKTEDVIEFQ